LNLLTKLSYGVGQLSDGVKQAAFSTFLFFYYNQVLGLSGSLAGAAALLALLVDAITDPMVGQLSDRFRSRWGRRHPFMLAGALPFGIAMVALFSPPEGLDQSQLFAWMLIGAIAVRLMLTLFFVPHLSLGAELVRDYHGRTSLIGYRVFFTYAGVLLTSVIGFAVFFPPTEAFANGMLNRESYPNFGWFCALLGTSSMLLSVFGTRHAIPAVPTTQKDTHQRSAWFAFIDVFRTLKLPSFRVLFFSGIIFATLAGTVQTLLVHVATYVFEFKPEQLAGLAGSLIVGIFFASWVAQSLSRRVDKRNALAICAILGGAFAFSPQILYFGGFLEHMSIGLKFGFVFSVNGLSHIFFIAYVILIDSMLSDVIDEHELHSHRREEGLFFAARAFSTKASFGLGAFLGGVGLDVIQFPAGASPATVSSEAVFKLAVLSGPLMFILFAATVLVSARYPLTAAKHGDILAAIKLRQSTTSLHVDV